MPKMSDQAISESLRQLPGWKLEGGKLVRDWSFPDFVQAMVFVNAVAEAAEAAGHHPDIDIRYNQVRLGLVSHDSGGITDRDVAMAANLSRQFPSTD